MNHKTTRLTLVPFVILLFSLALVAGLGLGRISPARANPDTRYVDDLLGSDTANDCTILTAPCKTIGRAINQSVDGDEIVIAAGTYNEVLSIHDRILTFTGAGQATTIIDAAGYNDNVFTISGGSVVTITGVTIQNGHNENTRPGGGIYSGGSILTLVGVKVFSNTATTDGGGGLANFGGTMTLINTTVVSNTSDGHGGGIRNMNPGATLVLIDSSVLSNTAGYSGGGIHNNYQTITLTNCTVAGNKAEGGSSSGGGLYNTGGSATLIDITVEDNEATVAGGGIYNYEGNLQITGGAIGRNYTVGEGGGLESENGGSVSLAGVTVERNRAGSSGGGIHNHESTLTIQGSTVFSNSSGSSGGGLLHFNANLTIANSIFVSNTTDNSGAGLYLDWYTTSTIQSTAIVSNTAQVEGGGLMVAGGGASLVLTNCTVSGNSAGTYGGGIESRVPMTATNCTIVNNSVSTGNGAGLFNYNDGNNTAAATFLNTIIANNIDMGGQPPDCDNASGATTNSQGHNLVEIVGDCTFSAGGDITGQDPVLGPLADSGGTWIHALLSGSPALNAGDDVGCPVTDQRGYRRVPPCDIGAYEHSLRVFLPLALRNH